MRFIVTTTMRPDDEIEVDERERGQLERDGVLNSSKAAPIKGTEKQRRAAGGGDDKDGS
jgi:hypothetical protein